MTMLQVLLPIFAIFAIGYIGQKKIGFDTKTLSTMALYLMSPVLVFRTFYQTEFGITHLYMTLYTLLLCLVLILIVYLICFIKKYKTVEISGIVLASAFMNNGNYGVPIVLLIFGAVGLDYAVILMVIQQLVMCTVGVYYAAKGSPDSNGFKSSINAVKRMPILYGALIGYFFQLVGIKMSEPLLQSINLVADAAIPTIMIILGMQLAKIQIKNLAKEKLTYSLSLRLALSPLIAYVITLFLPVDQMLKEIMIIMAAMPTAANTTMYALQFNTDPDFVSSATFLSTSLSLATLPIIFFFVL